MKLYNVLLLEALSLKALESGIEHSLLSLLSLRRSDLQVSNLILAANALKR